MEKARVGKNKENSALGNPNLAKANEAKLSLILPAAGTGSRMQTDINKQYLILKGKPLLAHTLEIFHDFPEIFEIIIASREEEIDYCQKKVLDPYDFYKVKKIVAGGKSRQESVYQAFKQVSSEADYVIVHDGARPFLSKKLAADFLDCLLGKTVSLSQETAGLIMGVPEKNTLKEVGSDGFILKTVAREKIWEIQTPQAFRREVLAQALEAGKENFEFFTDDASLVEALGFPLKIFRGSYLNLKMTTPEDLDLGERILELIEDENKKWPGL